MMVSPLVSIIVPCYNAEEYIGEAIYSICDQSYDNIEIIIVDDASSDNSKGKAIKALTTTASVRKHCIVSLSENGGACFAVELGFCRSAGKYAMMLAADDILVNPDYIADAVAALERGRAGWCYASIMLTGPNTHRANPVITKWLLHTMLDNLILKFPLLCKVLIRIRNPVNSSSLMLNMDIFRKERLSWSRDGGRAVCDGILLKQIFEKGIPGHSLYELGPFYRIHEKQVSHTKEFKKALDVFDGNGLINGLVKKT